MREKKKCKRNIIIISSISIITLMLLAIPVVRRAIVLSNLEQSALETKNITNFSTVARHYHPEEGRRAISRGYTMDDRFLMINSVEEGDIVRKTTTYISESDRIVVSEKNGIRVYYYINGINDQGEVVEINMGIASLFEKEWLFSYLRQMNNIFFVRISIDEFNSIPCYLIQLRDGTKHWVERETGIILRSEYPNGIINEFSYTVNTVRDSDIVRSSLY